MRLLYVGAVFQITSWRIRRASTDVCHLTLDVPTISERHLLIQVDEIKNHLFNN